MTDDERRDEMARYQEVLKDTLIPLMSDDSKKGLVAFRLFYAVAHGDGTTSAGNLGLTGEDHGAAALLVKAIAGLLVDIQGNREYGVIQTPPKS